ncbi:OstA-like protein [Flavobacterium crocinum]|uniref:OstA-like protein n=1 Tax=Flavobacterium crocinum TaxID=2183896 RepID=A0A2S1YNB1_9FLAO|nr:OstA-like protein [Flavobacterium crocinum]AWK05318.1 OstA-like protein [Flavobacterium crocinum]
MKKSLFFIFTCLSFLSVKFTFAQAKKTAQTPKTIIIENADYSDVDQVNAPDALLLTGNVKINHDGVVLTCNKAYFFQKENYLKAFGNVQLVQGDTLFLNSKYAEYSGNAKKAFATGDAVLTSPDATLRTDTINFDRNVQEAFYNTKGTIVNKDNTLVSKSGRYYAEQKKFQFLTEVVITNPKYVIKSNHLDYYSNSGHTYLLGPSTITSKENYIYTEKGFYDTKKNLAHFLRKSYIKYDDRRIEGDSLFYNRNTEFASATRNVKITDSINKGIVKGHYAELFKLKDSMFVTKRAVAINLVENDSVYIHGQKLMVTGKEGERILRAYKNVRFFKIDMSGKCDSIHSDSKIALTKLIGNPIIWNGESQITGDIMHLIGDKTTRKIDSLKVLNNTFLISKDTLGTGYNQVKGLNLFGKFRDGKLHYVDIIKNTEVIYYSRNDQNELVGIDKSVSSKINLILEDNKIETLTLFNNVDGDMFPEDELPENARKLRGMVWRGDERIKSKDDIFTAEENEMNEKLIQQGKEEEEKGKNVPMKVRKETLDYDKKKPAVKPAITPKKK